MGVLWDVMKPENFYGIFIRDMSEDFINEDDVSSEDPE